MKINLHVSIDKNRARAHIECHVGEYERYVTILLAHALMCVREIYIYIHVIRV